MCKYIHTKSIYVIASAFNATILKFKSSLITQQSIFYFKKGDRVKMC